MSRTTSATQLAPNLPMRRSVSCVKKFLGIGRTSVIRSPTISASSKGFSGCDVNGVYIPSPASSFAFTTTRSGKVIQPGLMYTDGGSIPRIAQIFGGFSPWGFGPAYAVHDWIFFGRHCILDGEDGPWFNDI